MSKREKGRLAAWRRPDPFLPSDSTRKKAREIFELYRDRTARVSLREYARARARAIRLDGAERKDLFPIIAAWPGLPPGQ